MQRFELETGPSPGVASSFADAAEKRQCWQDCRASLLEQAAARGHGLPEAFWRLEGPVELRAGEASIALWEDWGDLLVRHEALEARRAAWLGEHPVT